MKKPVIGITGNEKLIQMMTS
ncbi:hypothetical protein CGSSp11BS70_04348 [Streptococcus pneumoniae SP11-BS70]|nr:hypothetical protein CGSSp11BS70_04348 [Streptococcus pneumoniae SP11-BS70]